MAPLVDTWPVIVTILTFWNTSPGLLLLHLATVGSQQIYSAMAKVEDGLLPQSIPLVFSSGWVSLYEWNPFSW